MWNSLTLGPVQRCVSVYMASFVKAPKTRCRWAATPLQAFREPKLVDSPIMNTGIQVTASVSDLIWKIITVFFTGLWTGLHLHPWELLISSRKCCCMLVHTFPKETDIGHVFADQQKQSLCGALHQATRQAHPLETKVDLVQRFFRTITSLSFAAYVLICNMLVFHFTWSFLTVVLH